MGYLKDIRKRVYQPFFEQEQTPLTLKATCRGCGKTWGTERVAKVDARSMQPDVSRDDHERTCPKVKELDAKRLDAAIADLDAVLTPER